MDFSRPRPPRTSSTATTNTYTTHDSRSAYSAASLSPTLATPPFLSSRSTSSSTPPPRTPSASPGPGPMQPPRKRANDEMDQTAYLYSLRVAALHQHLVIAAPRPPVAPSPVQVSLPTPASHRLSATSTGSRRFTSFLSPDPARDELTVRRKKSALRISLSGKKDELKLPKEFLGEFWGILSAEDGDRSWKWAVNNLLGLVQKKGTKTASGLNMRDIPTLLETFSSCLPPPGPSSNPVHIYQTQFLGLLYDTLPGSAYFANSRNDKDKDLLFRLRAEVQVQLQASTPATPASSGPKTPTSGEEFSPQLIAHGMAAKAAISNGLPSPAFPKSELVYSSAASASDMLEAVALIWNVPRDTLERDLYDMKRQGLLEKRYLDDLKIGLSTLSRQAPSPEQRVRHSELSRALSDLLASFPDLTTPASPVGYQGPPEGLFFIPPRKATVFARVVKRAAEGGLTGRARDLIEYCEQVWGVESRADKEREVAALTRTWRESVGTKAELEVGERLADAVADLTALLPEGELPPVLADLYYQLIEHVTTAAAAIFPITSVQARGPPPSALLILTAAPNLFLDPPDKAAVIADLVDDLRAAAVGEYVAAAGGLMGGVSPGVGNGKSSSIEGFERVAEWIEEEVKNVRRAWGSGLGEALNPASIVLSKQLPLFLAELHVLETAGGAASDVFALYDVTHRLTTLWDELCPGMENGFDIDAFFEPHVVAWLRDTEDNDTHQWVSRTVGMDKWIPEGTSKSSQSVADLFEFIRNATRTVHDLPLSDYKRAVFLIDLSKTVSSAVTQYVGTVQGLYNAEMTPVNVPAVKETQSKPLGGKAGAWLAKSKHTMQKLDQKFERDRKREGFLIPAKACVKLTNMDAAQRGLEDMLVTMEADETARIMRDHKLRQSTVVDRPTRHVFSISILRGQGLLTRGGSKAADAFVSIMDRQTGQRLFKSRTVLETEDPTWDQTFEVSVGELKTLELVAYDRQLMGKHNDIGSRVFKLDRVLFESEPVRDIVLPLSPRGVVHLRISTEGGEVHDVGYHLETAMRALERTRGDMLREMADRIIDYVRAELSTSTLARVTRVLRDRKRLALTDEEVDQSLTPVLDYLDENLAVFNATFPNDTRIEVGLVIWNRLVETLISLLIPPLADRPYNRTALSGPEIDLVFKWLQLLKSFFNAAEDGIEHGVPRAALEAGPYRDLMMVGQYLDLPTSTLRERAAAAVRAATAASSAVGALRNLNISQGHQRSHGIAAAASRADEDNERVAEVLLRIARMRPDMDEFLRAQMAALIRAKVEKQGGVL